MKRVANPLSRKSYQRPPVNKDLILDALSNFEYRRFGYTRSQVEAEIARLSLHCETETNDLIENILKADMTCALIGGGGFTRHVLPAVEDLRDEMAQLSGPLNESKPISDAIGAVLNADVAYRAASNGTSRRAYDTAILQLRKAWRTEHPAPTRQSQCDQPFPADRPHF